MYTFDVWLKLLESKRDRQTEELIHLTHLSLDLDTSLIWIILITLKPGNLTSFTMSSFDSSLGVGSRSLRTTTSEGWAFYMRTVMPELQCMEVCDLEYNIAHLPTWRDKGNLQGFKEPREVFLVEPPPDSADARCLEGVGAAILNYAR